MKLRANYDSQEGPCLDHVSGNGVNLTGFPQKNLSKFADKFESLWVTFLWVNFLRFFEMLAFFVDGNLNENFIHFQKSSLEISIYKNRSLNILPRARCSIQHVKWLHIPFWKVKTVQLFMQNYSPATQTRHQFHHYVTNNMFHHLILPICNVRWCSV